MSFGFTLKQKHFFQFFFTTMQKFLQKQKLIQNLEKKNYCQNSTKMNFEKQNNYSTHKCQTRRGNFSIWLLVGMGGTLRATPLELSI